MIETLHIENIGIIDNITIDLRNGLNILTGETGAGKTLLIDSLSLICGNRFSKEIIKTGKEFCLVQIMISESKFGDSIIVSREISITGKNKCKIDGRMVTVSELKEYMKNIINIHGQNDNQNLLNESNYINYLDLFCSERLRKYKLEYKELYNKYLLLNAEILSNYGNEKERKRTLDLLEYEISEIDNANLKIDEEVNLENKSKIMRNSEKIYQNLNLAELKLNENVLSDLDEILKYLSKLDTYDDKYSYEKDRLQSLYYEIQDISQNLYSYKEDVSFDEEENDKTIKRLELIYSLKRKYGNNIEEILSYKNDIEKKKEKIENMEEHLKKLSLDVEKVKSQMLKLANNMDKIRKECAINLENEINNELSDLEMKNSRIKINVKFNEESHFNVNGLSNVEFKLLTNIGDEYKSLNKIASGGEISRIMLAMKKVLSKVDDVPVLIFDEIDTGISGKAGKVVGAKLKAISHDHQVICITHLAVVAAYADNNYYISKKVESNSTKSNIKLLNESETIKEIARIATGTISEIAISNAIELRNSAFAV